MSFRSEPVNPKQTVQQFTQTLYYSVCAHTVAILIAVKYVHFWLGYHI